MKKTNEAFWWSLFSAGGVTSALFLPALIVASGLLLPFRAGDDPAAQHERVHRLASFWPVRLVLFGVMVLALVHAAHRIRHILMDLGMREAATILSVACYGAAALVAVVAGLVLLAL